MLLALVLLAPVLIAPVLLALVLLAPVLLALVPEAPVLEDTSTGALSSGDVAPVVLARPALFLMIVNNYLQCAVGMIKKLM